MRLNPIIAAFLCLSGFAAAEPLSDSDREALIERLDSLKAAATERLDARFKAGVAAFQGAVHSNDAALDLYLKCIEKVDFIDQKKKDSEFREWKRKEGERLSKDSFKLALRHQLNWLSLTLQAASENPDREVLAQAAQNQMEVMFRDAPNMKDQLQVLRMPVTGTVFAKAYEINGLKLDKWPLNPVDLNGIYENVVMPRFRNPQSIDKLRDCWVRRIQQEGVIIENFTGNQNQGGRRREDGRIGMAENSRPPEMDKFASETVPTLQWQMEMDLFKAGDQAGAALRMLAHIEKNLANQKSKDWTDQFRNLLMAPAAGAGEVKAP